MDGRSCWFHVYVFISVFYVDPIFVLFLHAIVQNQACSSILFETSKSRNPFQDAFSLMGVGAWHFFQFSWSGVLEGTWILRPFSLGMWASINVLTFGSLLLSSALCSGVTVEPWSTCRNLSAFVFSDWISHTMFKLLVVCCLGKSQRWSFLRFRFAYKSQNVQTFGWHVSLTWVQISPTSWPLMNA